MLPNKRAHSSVGDFLFGVCCLDNCFTNNLGICSRGNLARMLYALSLAVLPMLLREFARCVCFAALKTTIALILDGSTSLIQLSALFLLARFRLLSVNSAYLVVGGAYLVGILGWFVLERKEFSFRGVTPIADLRKNWMTGKWVLASSVLWALSSYLYPWLLTAFHGTAAAGVWAACFGVVSTFNPIVLGLQNSVGPRIAHANSKEGFQGMRSFSAKALIGVGVLIAPFCVAISAFGGRLLSFIYGIKYGDSGMVVSVLAFNILFTALTVILSRVLLVVGKGKFDLFGQFFSLVLFACVGVWLTRSFGALGAAAGLLLGGLGGLIFRAFAYFRLVWGVGAQAE